MKKRLAVIIKVYNTPQEREKDYKPLDTRTVYTVEEFDVVVEEFSFPAKYLSFEGEHGAKLKTRDAARYVLLKA